MPAEKRGAKLGMTQRTDRFQLFCRWTKLEARPGRGEMADATDLKSESPPPPQPVNTEENKNPLESLRSSCADTYPALSRLVSRWPELTDAQRQLILQISEVK